MANIFRCDKCNQYADGSKRNDKSEAGSVTIRFVSDDDDYGPSDICLDLCAECLDLFKNLSKPLSKV